MANYSMQYIRGEVNNYTHKDQVKDVEIVWHEDSTGVELLDFIDKYRENQTILIDVRYVDLTMDMITAFKVAAEKHSIRILCEIGDEFLDQLKDAGLDFEFSSILSDWEDLVNAVAYKPAAIRVGGALAFEMVDVWDYCHGNRVAIKVYVNVAQGYGENNDPMKFFWISPIGIPYYEQFVDVFMFYGNNLEKQKTLYDIYTSGRWAGDLCSLILGLELDNPLYEDSLPAELFYLKRLECGKKCLHTTRCSTCDRCASLANALAAADLVFNREENDSEEENEYTPTQETITDADA